MLGAPKVENEHFFNMIYGLALGALALVNGGLGWFLNMLHARTEKTSSDLSAFKEKVAEEYAELAANSVNMKHDIGEIKAGINNIQNFLLNQAANGNGGRKK